MTSRRANIVTAAALLALLAVVALTAPRWAHVLRREMPGQEEGSAAGEDEAARVERQINVKLFFQAADRPGLAVEERPVSFAPDLDAQVRAVVEELVRGPRQGLQPTLAPNTRVLEVFVSARGVAYVDLSKEAQAIASGGSEAELITVYSIVNSLIANFPALKRVQILVEDRPAATLAGHVDLTRPLLPDMTLLASSPVAPVASGQ
ncbi:MAG TPA: GerMN domain-containing protein [Vicinamibacteria bacterium]|nr:GerMN domain-containing protein [Vicinamibacteria bacterium]